MNTTRRILDAHLAAAAEAVVALEQRLSRAADYAAKQQPLSEEIAPGASLGHVLHEQLSAAVSDACRALRQLERALESLA